MLTKLGFPSTDHRYWYTKLLRTFLSVLETNNYRECSHPYPLATLELMSDPKSLPGPLRHLTLQQVGGGTITAARNVLIPLTPTFIEPHAPVIPIAQANVRPLLFFAQKMALEQNLAAMYLSHILTLPLVVPKAGVDCYILLPAFITRLHDQSKPLPLPESPLSSGPSSTWLLGNLSYLMATVPNSNRLPEDLLAQALDVLGALLVQVPCGFVSDRGAITQYREGSSYVTKVRL